jgi:5-methylcytosine-specific restriction protein A
MSDFTPPTRTPWESHGNINGCVPPVTTPAARIDFRRKAGVLLHMNPLRFPYSPPLWVGMGFSVGSMKRPPCKGMGIPTPGNIRESKRPPHPTNTYPPAWSPYSGTYPSMPWKPPSRCAAPQCPELTHNVRCPEHAREVEQKRKERETWRDYGPEWKLARAKVLKAEPNCRTCGEPATEVDHITSLKDGGTHDLSNLRPLCKSCHSKRTYSDTIRRKKG